MKCPMCSQKFSEKESQKECKSCSLFGSCKKVKCPNCGYEMPQEATLIKLVKKIKNKL